MSDTPLMRWREALWASGLSASARHLALEMQSVAAPPACQCYLAADRLAYRTGLHISTVRKLRPLLVAAGLFEEQKRPAHTSIYTLRWPDEGSSSATPEGSSSATPGSSSATPGVVQGDGRGRPARPEVQKGEREPPEQEVADLVDRFYRSPVGSTIAAAPDGLRPFLDLIPPADFAPNTITVLAKRFGEVPAYQREELLRAFKVALFGGEVEIRSPARYLAKMLERAARRKAA